jgi:hypothetical protein
MSPGSGPPLCTIEGPPRQVATVALVVALISTSAGCFSDEVPWKSLLRISVIGSLPVDATAIELSPEEVEARSPALQEALRLARQRGSVEYYDAQIDPVCEHLAHKARRCAGFFLYEGTYFEVFRADH